MANKGYDKLLLACNSAYPQQRFLKLGTSEHETPISKPAWRNIGGANTAFNEKRGGQDYLCGYISFLILQNEILKI